MRRPTTLLAAALAIAGTAGAAAGSLAAVAQTPVGPRAWTPAPSAQVGDVTRAQQLFNTLMSPFCPGLTLANCPSIHAETLRTSVRRRLEAGEHPDSITESLVAAFGERVRGAPRKSGFGLALWALPAVLLVGGGAALSWWIRRRGVVTAPAQAAAPPAGGADPALLERVRAAVRDDG
jgi:cytochrome c-type biogenesis protein CcmH